MTTPHVHAGLAEGLCRARQGHPGGCPDCLHTPSDFIADLLVAVKPTQGLERRSAAAPRPHGLHVREAAQLLQGEAVRGAVCCCSISSEFQRTETAEGKLHCCADSKYSRSHRTLRVGRDLCEGQWDPGVHQKECGQQVEGGSPSPLP